jgi:hypothetical protein
MGIALLAAVAPWFFVVRTMHGAHPVEISTKPQNSLVWGDRVFSSQAALGRWLRSRGSAYDTWLATHPAGAAVLAHKPWPAPAAPPKAPVQTAAAKSIRVLQRPPTAALPPKGRAHTATAKSRSRPRHQQAPRAAAAPTGRTLTGAANTRSGHLLWELAVFLLAGLAAVLLAFATVPQRILALVRPQWANLSVDMRIVAFAGAFSIGVGALVARVGG